MLQAMSIHDQKQKNEPYPRKREYGPPFGSVHDAEIKILVILAVSAVVLGIILVVVLTVVSGVILVIIVTVVSGVVLIIVLAVVAAVVSGIVLVIIHIVVLRHEKYLLKCLFIDYNHSMVQSGQKYSQTMIFHFMTFLFIGCVL